jgi:predicted nucleotide-binding protein
VSGVVRISEPDWKPCIAVARRGGLLWPKEPDVTAGSNGHFTSEIYEGGSSGIITVTLLAVPPEGVRVVEDWIKAGSQTGHWPGLRISDLSARSLDEVQVYFDPDIAEQGGGRESELPRDRRTVFVVSGRNEAARRAMFDFLWSINLRPLEWSAAVAKTGSSSPYIGQVLEAGMAAAQAVVVLFTPDDLARLNPVYLRENDPDYERREFGQARPNVIYEAGMAMGLDPKRTVLVELGTVRAFTDISGIHILRLDNSAGSRSDFAQRLNAAGCDVDLDGTGWHHAGGDFLATLPITPPKPEYDDSD